MLFEDTRQILALNESYTPWSCSACSRVTTHMKHDQLFCSIIQINTMFLYRKCHGRSRVSKKINMTTVVKKIQYTNNISCKLALALNEYREIHTQ